LIHPNAGTAGEMRCRAIHSIATEDALTTAFFRVYYPYTIMSDLKTLRSVRWISAAVLALTFVVGAGAGPQSGGMPRSQRHESRHEIDQLEQTWKDAIVQRNISAMESLLADDYLAITPNGTLQSRDQTLAALRSGSLMIKSLEFSDRKVRFYGQTALVTSRAELTGTNAGANYSGSYRYTRVYVRNEQGKWKIVSFEASRIRDEHK
jgi:ketosteroid isomerase-like protein